jgi:hypothetical protein
MVSISADDALTCCASPAFAQALASTTHSSVDALIDHARIVWWQQVGLLSVFYWLNFPQNRSRMTRHVHVQVPIRGWLEAFDAHPRIGDLEGLRKKYGAFSDLSRSEQAAASDASPEVLQVWGWTAAQCMCCRGG